MSSLKLNQLLVSKNGKEVYNEKFHSGINIIRGHNSSGKSTVSNFIFFALGGEFLNWLPEALSCDFVVAEVTINDKILTLKRAISDSGRRPMAIYIGTLEQSLNSAINGWIVHPYNKNDNNESFSQLLFKILNFPEISSDNEETITINQILRLIYIDQLSSLDGLMRNEDFDSPTVRQAIGYLLLGTYDDILLRKQMELKERKKELVNIDKQITAIEDVLKNSEFELHSEKILQTKQKKETELNNINTKLAEPIVNKNTGTETQKSLENFRISLTKAKNEFNQVANQIDILNLDIIDSGEFISEVEEKIIAINESLNARESFKDINISYCPVCLGKLTNEEADNICHLCKVEKEPEATNSKVLRAKLELDAQLKESKILFQDKTVQLTELTDVLDSIKKTIKTIQTDYDIFINQTRTTTESFYDKLLEQKGKLKSDIEFLDKEMQLHNSYSAYMVQKAALKSRIGILESETNLLAGNQERKTQTVFASIQKYTLELLKGDGEYESTFVDGKNVSLSFSKNSFYLDGRNRFSASSMVLLKNCVRFAIFFASIELDFMRYPKFILCDNIEDKGMEEARSKNFQKNIVNIANSKKFEDKDFQMIFSTSMINDDLNIEPYTIGEFYDENNKTLKL